MAFLSQRDLRQQQQSFVAAGPQMIPSSFEETFAASVGQVIDEGLSISSLLNNEGFDQRKRQVRDYGYADQFNIRDYTREYGVLDYDRLSADYPDLEIKTDRQLYDDRNEVLRKRREYADDVIKRGSGMAQFLGYSAYLLDPINIATMPIATAGVAAKSLGAIGYALNVAGRSAGIAAASELAIQPLVYRHKHDINSPYEFNDALMAITMAATGGAVLGGVVGGISGYFRKVRATAETQALDNDARAALEYLERLETQLNSNPAKKAIKFKEIEDDFILEIKQDLLADVSQKLTRGEKVNLKTELSGLEHRLGKVTEDPLDVQKAKGVPARKAKSEARERVSRVADDERLNLNTQIDAIKLRLDADAAGSVAEANLTRLEQGIIPDEFAARLNKIKSDVEIEIDAEFMTQINAKMEAMNPPSKEYENYIAPERASVPPATASQRQREGLVSRGLDTDYDQDIAAFNKLENPHIMQDGEIVPAGDFMKGLDDDMKSLDEIMVCAIG